MEKLVSKIQKTLQTIKGDLAVLLDNHKRVGKDLSANLKCVVNVYQEIADCIHNELLYSSNLEIERSLRRNFVNNSDINDNLSHYLELLRWELSRRHPDWIVLGQTSTSLRILRINEENGKVQFGNQVVIQVLPTKPRSRRLSVPIQILSGNLNVLFDVVKNSFVSRMLLLLKAFLPSSVVVNKRCLFVKVERPPSSIETLCKGNLSVANSESPVSVVKREIDEDVAIDERLKVLDRRDVGVEEANHATGVKLLRPRRECGRGGDDAGGCGSEDAGGNDDTVDENDDLYSNYGSLCHSVHRNGAGNDCVNSLVNSMESSSLKTSADSQEHSSTKANAKIVVEKSISKVNESVPIISKSAKRSSGKNRAKKSIPTRQQNDVKMSKTKTNCKIRNNFHYHLPCSRCKKVFKSVVTARNHLRKHHEVNEDICVVCPDRKFVSVPDRRTHYSVCHNPTLNSYNRTQPCKECHVPLSRTQAWTHMEIGGSHFQSTVCKQC